MLKKAVTQEEYDAFQRILEAHINKWSKFLKVKRSSLKIELKESIDLMHLLLAYNLPGLPGYIEGGDVPGTDIHSLINREPLMRKYFPFSVKQGLVNKFLTRENIFFSFSTLSLFYNKPVFLFFTSGTNEKKIEIFETKIRTILEWFKSVTGIKFEYIIIDTKTGKNLKSSFENPYPVFRKDVFLFFLLTDFIPMGIPFFLYLKLGIKQEEIHFSWKNRLGTLEFEKKFFFSDIFSKIPTSFEPDFFAIFMEWMFRKHNNLAESFIFTSIISLEEKNNGIIWKNIELNWEKLELFTCPIIFFYLMFIKNKQKLQYPQQLIDIFQKIFYLTIREKKEAISSNFSNLLEEESFLSLQNYISEPFYYEISQIQQIEKEENAVLNSLKEIIEQLYDSKNSVVKIFAKEISKTFNLENRFVKQYFYPVKISRIKYDKVLVIYRAGLEKPWELLLESDSLNHKELIYRASSIEEIFLFAIINEIHRTNGIHFENVTMNITMKADKLWNNIETWIESNEKVFLGINYSIEKTALNDKFYMLSTVSDVLNVDKSSDSLVSELTLFIKSSKKYYIEAVCFSEKYSMSHFLSVIYDNFVNFEDFRLSMCHDRFYRPILMTIEMLLQNRKKFPLVLRENGKFNLILKHQVNSFNTFYELLEKTSQLNLTDFSVVKVSGELPIYEKISEVKRTEGVDVFYSGKRENSILLFVAGVFAGGYLISSEENIDEYLISIFRFVNSIILKQRTLSIKIYKFEDSWSNSGKFIEATNNIEFKSMTNKYDISALEIMDNGSIMFSLNKKKYYAENIEKLKEKLQKETIEKFPNFVDFCNNYPQEKYTIKEIVTIKVKIDKLLRGLK